MRFKTFILNLAFVLYATHIAALCYWLNLFFQPQVPLFSLLGGMAIGAPLICFAHSPHHPFMILANKMTDRRERKRGEWTPRIVD